MKRCTYTLVQVDGVFAGDDVTDSASLLLGTGHCDNVFG